jgi:hypothetical protein
VTLEASAVRATSRDALGSSGRGVSVISALTSGLRAKLALESSLVEGNDELGMIISGSDATLESSVVRATVLNPTGQAARGIQVQDQPPFGPAVFSFHASIVEQMPDAGIMVVDSTATITSSVVRDTVANVNGQFGDGLVVWSVGGAADLSVTATRVERSARAALATHGSHALLGGSVFACQAFDIDVESSQTRVATLENLGGLLCGCPEATDACKAVSAKLEPPPPLAPPVR